MIVNDAFRHSFDAGDDEHEQFRAEVQCQFERLVNPAPSPEGVSAGQLYAALFALGCLTVALFSLLAVWLIGNAG